MAEDCWRSPGRWAARAQAPILSNKWRYAVCLNNHTDVAWFDTMREAELEAARLNYVNGSDYGRPRLLGMDGLPA